MAMAGKVSSFCQDDSCVEVSRHRDYLAVQQTDTDSDVVIFTRSEWDAFILGVKAGEFDWDKL
jgi:hypothetical protein